jgi:hypothetical protein
VSPSPEVPGVVATTPAHGRPGLHAALRDADGGGSGGDAHAGSGCDGACSSYAAGSSGGDDRLRSSAYPGPTLQRLLDEVAALLRRAGAPSDCSDQRGRGAHRHGGGSGDSRAESGSGGQAPGRQGGFWLVVDADGAQAPPPGAPASLLEAAVAAWGRRVLVLVQNVHFLPFGPEGTGPRRPGLLAAWAAAGGAVAPSAFVADYLISSGGLARERVVVAPHAAWGAFGAGPFEDAGARAAARLAAREERRRQREEAAAVAGSGRGATQWGEEGGEGLAVEGEEEGTPMVLMLKLNR